MDFRLTSDDQSMIDMFEEVGKKVVAPWAERAEAGEHPAEATRGPSQRRPGGHGGPGGVRRPR